LQQNTAIEEITFKFDSDYSQGRHCCRFELFKVLTEPTEQPYVRNIHEKIRGKFDDKKNNFRPYLEAYIALNYGPTVRDFVLKFIKDLIKCTVSTFSEAFCKGRFPNYGKFFVDANFLVHKHKRVVTKEIKIKGKKPERVITVLEAVRPSTLSSVCEVERNAVIEFFENPWRRLEYLKDQYTNADPWNIARHSFDDKFKECMNDMWNARQRFLHSTKNRLRIADCSKEESVETRITKLRDLAIRVGHSYEGYVITFGVNGIDWFPAGPYRVGDETFTSFNAFAISENAKTNYQYCCAFAQQYRETAMSYKTFCNKLLKRPLQERTTLSEKVRKTLRWADEKISESEESDEDCSS